MAHSDPTFNFKKVTPEDLPILFAWFKKPHIQEWWPVPAEYEDFFDHFLTRIRSHNTVPFMVFMDKKPIGYIQYYHIDRSRVKTGAWLPELPSNTVGIDQFIGEPDYIGKGYGTLFIKQFIDYLSTLGTISTIIVDPDPTNYAAIRCYEKVGFTPVGTFTTEYGPAYLMRFEIP